MLLWFIYLCGIIGSVGAFFKGVAAVTLVVCALTVIVVVIAKAERAISEETSNKLFKKVKILSICAVFSLFISSLLPTEKTMYLMAGGYAVQKVVENPRVQSISDKVLNVLDKKLDDVLKEEEKHEPTTTQP